MTSLRQAVGTAIRRRRHKLSLSQEDFAERADIHRTYVSKIEAGKVDVGLEVAFRVARALGMKLSALISEAEKSERGKARVA